jgi:hypothetical protein
MCPPCWDVGNLSYEHQFNTSEYSAELNKYILLVRVFAKNTGFEDSQMSLAAKAAQDIHT